MSFKVDYPTINLDGMYLSKSTHAIIFFRCHNHISKGKPRFQTWTCPLSALLLLVVVRVHSIMDCLWATLPSTDLNVLVLLSINKRNLLFPDSKHSFDGFHWIIIWLCFFATGWSKYCFPPKVHCIVQAAQLFKEGQKVLMSFLLRILQTRSMFVFVREFLLF